MKKEPKPHLHEVRGVELRELMALLGVEAALEQKLIGYHSEPEARALQGEHMFNMRCSLEKNSHCGTVGCIGGYMAMVLGALPLRYVDRKGKDNADYTGKQFVCSTALCDLFFPPDNLNWKMIQPEHALRAIRNWKRTGDPGWYRILRGRKYAAPNGN